MNKIFSFIFLFISLILNAQEPLEERSSVQDSIKNKSQKQLLSDSDIAFMDSVLIASKFNSPLFDKSIPLSSKNFDEKQINPVQLSPAILKEQLDKIDTKTPFHIQYNPALKRTIFSYLNHIDYKKKYYSNLMAKALYYFPIFEKYLDQYDIPLEMKYLAVVESALKPKIKSRVGATGLWQLMYGVAKQFNLKISSYVDERQNPIKSTIAACKYLRNLYKTFKDWNLVLAAYNSGPGNVFKAIKRSGGHKNYWNIRPFLPRETAQYVPAFYTTMYLFKYAKQHHLFSKTPVIYHFQTDTIHIKRTVSFRQISTIIGLDYKVLEFLNPSYKLGIIPYIKSRNYALTLPKNKVILFLENEKKLYSLADQQDKKREKPLPKYFEMDQRIYYKVKRGDVLGKIALKFGVHIKNIKRWNQLKNSRLKIGQRLTIYPKKIGLSRISSKNKRHFSSKKYSIYIVKKGDSLWTISKKFPKVSVEKIKKWNNIWKDKTLKPGTKLKIFKN